MRKSEDRLRRIEFIALVVGAVLLLVLYVVSRIRS
jgi:hypothetical protein